MFETVEDSPIKGQLETSKDESRLYSAQSKCGW